VRPHGFHPIKEWVLKESVPSICHLGKFPRISY